jgi:hypothetical protein
MLQQEATAPVPTEPTLAGQLSDAVSQRQQLQQLSKALPAEVACQHLKVGAQRNSNKKNCSQKRPTSITAHDIMKPML